MLQILRTLLTCGPAVLLLGCDRGWPLYKDEMVQNYHQNKAQLIALEQKIDSSKYFRAHIGIPETAHLDYDDGEYIRSDRLDDENGALWHQMLRDAMVHSVESYEGEYLFMISENLDGNNDTADWARYVHRTGEPTPKHECKDEYRKLPCGYCTVALDDGWWISVRWFEYSPDKSIVDAYYDDKITFEQYEEQNDRALEECEIEGATFIGYPYKPIQDTE